MDKIVMKNLMFYGYHGVLEEENKLGQKFVISLELLLDLQKAGSTDNVADTVSYAEVYEDIKNIVENTKFNLLEALAEKMAQQILGKYIKVKEVLITLKKPQAPVAGIYDYFAVEIRRKRND